MRRLIISGIILMFLISLLFVFRLILNRTSPDTAYVVSWGVFLLSCIGWIGWMIIDRKHILTSYQEAKPLYGVALILLIMEVLLMIKQGSIITMTYPFGLLLSLFSWLTLGQIIPRKTVKWYGIITLIIFGSYVIGQDVYVRIFHDYFSFKEALTLREGIESGESMYRFSWLHPTIFVMMIGSVIWFVKQIKKGSVKPSIVQLKRSFFILIMLIITMFIQATYPTKDQTIFTSDVYLYRSVFSRKDVARHFGFFHLMGRDIVDTLTPPIALSRDEKAVDDYISNHLTPASDHEYVGLFEGKNLIFILAESYDEIALDPILTPHLYQLQSESITFSNHFTPVFQRTTSDTEFIFNTGLIPSIEDGPTVSVFKQNTYTKSLANRFKENGYLTQAFHGNYKEFYGRHILYENYGFDAFYGRDELELTPEDGRFDTRFFNAGKDIIIPSDGLFMSFLITFSGHSPYTEHHVVGQSHIDEVNALYPDDDPSLNYYRATQIELDLMIGLLIEALNEKGRLDDTIILLSGDHYPYTMPQDVYEDASGITELHLKHQGNLYLWSTSILPQSIDKMTTSFDILPTLDVLFGLSDEIPYSMGHDMFSPCVTPVLYKDYAFYDGNNYVRLTDLKTTTPQARDIEELYLIMKKILRTNYYRKDRS